jgi:hypothetical protein
MLEVKAYTPCFHKVRPTITPPSRCAQIFVESGIVSRSEVDEWLGEQSRLHANGEFFQMWFFVLVCGVV